MPIKSEDPLDWMKEFLSNVGKFLEALNQNSLSKVELLPRCEIPHDLHHGLCHVLVRSNAEHVELPHKTSEPRVKGGDKIERHLLEEPHASWLGKKLPRYNERELIELRSRSTDIQCPELRSSAAQICFKLCLPVIAPFLLPALL
jgi:hypothetical protein